LPGPPKFIVQMDMHPDRAGSQVAATQLSLRLLHVMPLAQVHSKIASLHVGRVVVVLVVVVLVVVVVTQTLPVQTSPAGQSPQLRVSGQLPSMMRPHCAPSAVHDEGVQHCPLGRFPGGLLLTQTRPQQL
jgi:hypothetical protein